MDVTPKFILITGTGAGAGSFGSAYGDIYGLTSDGDVYKYVEHTEYVSDPHYRPVKTRCRWVKLENRDVPA